MERLSAEPDEVADFGGLDFLAAGCANTKEAQNSRLNARVKRTIRSFGIELWVEN
jgi:hypothetical protein